MSEIGIGIIGGGYMGKAHAVARAAVGAVFGTKLRPRRKARSGIARLSDLRGGRATGASWWPIRASRLW